MKRYLPVILALPMALSSCDKGLERDPYGSTDFEYGKDLSHEMIVLGDRLENPYKTVNMQAALASVYPTKGRVPVETTDLYVRFLPLSRADEDMLTSLGVDLVDHPLDYAIQKEGDYYVDPALGDGRITWQYAVVPKDFVFPDITYEVIDECFLSENSASTRAGDGIDWDEVEREAYRLTGNESRLAPSTKAAKSKPQGRITLVDPDADGGKPVGVAGITVAVNSFVKIGKAVCDRDGYYTIDKEFSSDVRYRLVFQNEKDFAIGFNMILVPASVSTLGKSGPEGVNLTVTRDSEDKLWRRCVVNNAAYNYMERCSKEDLDINTPPGGLRFWIFGGLNKSAALMAHHGTLVSNTALGKLLGEYSPLLTYFTPDIMIGAKDLNTCRELYSNTCHEMAHASHYARVGNEWWHDYIMYIVESFIKDWELSYGDGQSDNAGLCELGEMWAYYLQAKMEKERYGGELQTYGTSWWFFPQVFHYLEERGFTASEIIAGLDPDVRSRASLITKLAELYPARRTTIDQAFNRYK